MAEEVTSEGRRPLPGGAVTFLFTDIGGSTRLFQRFGDEWGTLLDRHRRVLRRVFADHGGAEVRTEGDSFFVAFDDPVAALSATAAVQSGLAAEEWPEGGEIRVRVGVHTGYAVPQDGDYVALAVHQAARVTAAAHPGQSLVTEETVRAAGDRLPDGVELVDLGSQRLRDFDTPHTLFELRRTGSSDTFPPLETTWRGETNLPLPRTRFVGRAVDVDAVDDLFDSSRIVTITGPGGAGKTRLALQTGATMLDGSGDGVWLVELAPLTDPALVASTVANALRVAEKPGGTARDSLVEWLGDKRLLLILDNCEHVVDQCAELVDALVAACPQLHVLATSRQPLGVAGETVYRLRPLAVPPAETPLAASEAATFEAVELFIERARAHQPQFVLDDTTVDAVCSICRRLDGLPLAIELAAARLRSLSVETIDTRLDDQFRILTGGHRSALPRQQGMRALIDWSYDLLDDDERELLRALSVFAGGWTLDAAEAIGRPGERDVLDLLTSLVDKSLVQAETLGRNVRYSLLEPVRQYAAGKVIEPAEADAVRRRHRDYYLALAEHARKEASTAAQRTSLDRLDAEDPNLRAALAYCAEDPDGTEAALRFVAALARYWVMRGRAVEGMTHAEAALGRPDAAAPTHERARALMALASLNTRSGDFSEARRLINEALAIYRVEGNDGGVANALNDLAWLATRQEDFAEAERLATDALRLAEKTDNVHLVGRIHATLGDLIERSDILAGRRHFDEARRRFDEVGDRGASARVLNNIGLIDLSRGDLAASRRALEECMAIFSDLQDAAALPTVLSNLGLIAVEEGEHERAQEMFHRALTLGYRARDKELMVYTVVGLAVAAGALGDSHRSAVLHGVADALAADLGLALDHVEARMRDRSLEELAAVVGAEEVDRTRARGRSLDVDEGVEFALDLTADALVADRP